MSNTNEPQPSESQAPPPSDPQENPEAPPAEPLDAPEALPPPSPPPAAKIVVESTKTERELTLERDLKVRETRVNELEDENRQLKELSRRPPPPSQKKSWLQSWLDGED